MARTRAKYPLPRTAARTWPATSNCTSSRGRCWRRRTSRSALSPASVGQSRLRVTVTGEAGHAGTVPMALRHDALAGAAEMALALEGIVKQHPEDGMVGTVGRIEALPGAVNIIPGTVDVHHRSALADRRAAACGAESIRDRGETHRRQTRPVLFDGGLPRDRDRALRTGLSGWVCCRDHGTRSHAPSACRPAPAMTHR